MGSSGCLNLIALPKGVRSVRSGPSTKRGVTPYKYTSGSIAWGDLLATMRTPVGLIRYLLCDTLALKREYLTPLDSETSVHTYRSKQRGASLMETSIAMGLVGIAVFASVSSFGGDIKGRISREIVPALGGGILSNPNPSQPASNNSASNPELQIGYTQDGSLGGGEGVGGGPGEQFEWEGGPVGGEDGDFGLGGGEGVPPDNNNLGSVAGTDASPPTTTDETGGNSSSDSSSWSDDNSFVAGTDASPPVNDGSGGSQSSSELADPSNALW